MYWEDIAASTTNILVGLACEFISQIKIISYIQLYMLYIYFLSFQT
jgi:hypothetical protein